MSTMGRPSKYTDELADAICTRLAEGESLTGICRDEGMPARQTIVAWARDDRGGFYAKYTRARDIGLDVMADDCLTIADDGSNDTYLDAEGNERTNHDVINRSRLRVDTRKWYLAKLAPKRYGEKISTEITNPDGSLQAMNEAQTAGRLAAIMAAAQARRAAGQEQAQEDEPGSDLV